MVIVSIFLLAAILLRDKADSAVARKQHHNDCREDVAGTGAYEAGG